MIQMIGNQQMTSPISSAKVAPQQPAAVASSSKASAAKATTKVDSDGDNDASTHVAASSTKVTISAAGQLAAAANKEAMETPAQTAQEAQGSDMQAKRLLAKEQVATRAAKG